MIRPALIAGAVLAAPAAYAQDMTCVVDVAVSGSQQNLMDRDFTAHVLLKDVALAPTTVGFGPGANLAFETTILDGRFALAQKVDGKMALSATPAKDQGTVFLVRANAGAWQPLPDFPGVFDLAELSDTIGEYVRDQGCEGDVTFPFKLTAHVAELSWSVESKPEKATGTLEDADVTIAGIYSNHDKKATFMVPGFNLHAHFVTSDGTLAGHIVDVSTEDGATLYVPAN